jgi:Phage integrase SAM-like domain
MTSLKIYLETSIPSIVREAYPLMIELAHMNTKININTPYILPEKNFDWFNEKVMFCRETLLTEEKVDEINDYLVREQAELKTIIEYFEAKKEPYTAADVENYYHRQEYNNEFENFVIRFVRLRKKRGGKIGIYSNLIKQIELYVKQQYPQKKTPLCFDEIDQEWMEGFYGYIHNLFLSQSAKNLYIRMFNDICLNASRAGLIYRGAFLKGKLAHKADSGKEKVLSSDIIQQLENADLKGDRALIMARDIFLFCYYADCMPFNSLAALKSRDIYDGMIWYKLYKRSRKQVSIRITPVINKLIEKYKTDGEYVFPLFNNSSIEEEEQCRIQLLRYNRLLKKISVILGLHVSLNSNIMSKIVTRKKSVDNTIVISTSFNGNMRAVKIACPEGCNIEELVMMNLKKMMGYNLTG